MVAHAGLVENGYSHADIKPPTRTSAAAAYQYPCSLISLNVGAPKFLEQVPPCP